MLVSEGSLIVKILKRTAEFKIEAVDFHARHHENSSGSLQIPKKTKVFVEQTIRERENASGISIAGRCYRFISLNHKSTKNIVNHICSNLQ